MKKMKKFAIVTMDWKGSYDDLSKVKGMMIHGAEGDIKTHSDGQLRYVFCGWGNRCQPTGTL